MMGEKTRGQERGGRDILAHVIPWLGIDGEHSLTVFHGFQYMYIQNFFTGDDVAGIPAVIFLLGNRFRSSQFGSSLRYL